MAGWNSFRDLVAEETAQQTAERCDAAGFPERLADIGEDATGLRALYEELRRLPFAADCPYTEPVEWDDVRLRCVARQVHPERSRLAEALREAVAMVGPARRKRISTGRSGSGLDSTTPCTRSTTRRSLQHRSSSRVTHSNGASPRPLREAGIPTVTAPPLDRFRAR
jgi:hypothetical protein